MKQLKYLIAVFTNKCPRCREGDLYKKKNAYNFKNIVNMNEHCPVCGQATELEVGFYYGTGYVSYALCIVLVVSIFVAWKVLFGLTFNINDNGIFYCMGTSIALLIICQPLLMRLSRSLWLSWFVPYDANWKNVTPEDLERTIPNHMSNL